MICLHHGLPEILKLQILSFLIFAVSHSPTRALCVLIGAHVCNLYESVLLQAMKTRFRGSSDAVNWSHCRLLFLGE